MTDQFVVAPRRKVIAPGIVGIKKARADLGGQAPAFTKQPRITIRYAAETVPQKVGPPLPKRPSPSL